MPPITLRGVEVETTKRGLVAVFTLSEVPDPAWITFFRERARYSVFNATAAKFRHHDVRIDLPRREDLAELIRSIERFIEGANWDVEIRGPS